MKTPLFGIQSISAASLRFCATTSRGAYRPIAGIVLGSRYLQADFKGPVEQLSPLILNCLWRCETSGLARALLRDEIGRPKC